MAEQEVLVDTMASSKKASQVQEAGVDTKAAHYCSEHPSKEITFYCEVCAKFICLECVSMEAQHHCHSYKKLDWFKRQIVSSLEPLKEKLATIDKSLQQIDTICKEVSEQESTAVADVDRTVADINESIEMHKNELVKQIRVITREKLAILSSHKIQIESSREQLQQCQDDIEDQLKQSDKKAVVEQKDQFIKQISEVTAGFNPDVLSPSDVIADVKFEPVQNHLNFKCGTLSARELLPDPSKCYVVDEALEQKIHPVRSKVTVTVQAINNLGNPCHLSRDKAPCLEFKLSSVFGGALQHEQCRISDSKYKLSFTPSIKGLHYLRVKINSCHIRGSPFTITVWSSAESLSRQISLFDCVDSPWGIAVNSKHNIVVTERAKHRVTVLSPDGKILQRFGTIGSSKGQFNCPQDVALDHDDNIAVVDCENHRIQMFTEKGDFLRQVGRDDKEPFQFKAPIAIAFNTCNKFFYVIDDRKHSSVQILSPEFVPCGSLGVKLTGSLSSWRIGCDSLGKVYVANERRVEIFEAEGTYLKSIGIPSKISSALLLGGIAFDERNLIYFSSHNSNMVFILNSEGKLVKQLHIPGMLYNNKLNNCCRGITVDRCGILYVCNTYNNCVRMY